MVTFYLKLKVFNKNGEIVEHCFMRQFVTEIELEQKTKELINTFESKENIKISLGY